MCRKPGEIWLGVFAVLFFTALVGVSLWFLQPFAEAAMDMLGEAIEWCKRGWR